MLWNLYGNARPLPDPNEPDGLKHPVKTTMFDSWVMALAEKNLRWRPLFVNSPSWNRPLPGETNWTETPFASYTPPPWEMAPLEPGLARGAIRELFRRYGEGGTFWSDNDMPDTYAIRSIEAWNEPNFSKSCRYGYRFQPAPFARFLRAVADGAHDVDPDAEIIVGGLVDHLRTTRCGISIKDYLTVVAATDPTLPADVDTIGLHVYNDDPTILFDRVGMARGQIDETPFAGAAIDLNEFNDNPNDSDGEIASDRRAVLQEIAKRAAGASGSRCNIRSIAPYAWKPHNTEYDIAPHADAYEAGIVAATPGDAPCAITTEYTPPTTGELVPPLP